MNETSGASEIATWATKRTQHSARVARRFMWFWAVLFVYDVTAALVNVPGGHTGRVIFLACLALVAVGMFFANLHDYRRETARIRMWEQVVRDVRR